MKKLTLILALILLLASCGYKKPEEKTKAEKPVETKQEHVITKSEIVAPSKYLYEAKEFDEKTTTFLDFDRNQTKVSYSIYPGTDIKIVSSFRTEDNYIFVEHKNPDSDKIDHKFKLEKISNKELKLVKTEGLEWKNGTVFSLKEEKK